MDREAAAIGRRIVRAWRQLTGGGRVRDAQRPTLLAVSGGADSSALALALAARPGVGAIGHIVHDLRPPEEAEADRDAVERLGTRLGLPVRVARVRVPQGNAEAGARRVRYQALADLAQDAGCRYVAAAHQADDVLETMLANLIRGAGPRGLRGPAPRRTLREGVTLVRPMLHTTRADALAVCAAHDWTPVHDATNDDPGTPDARLRAALRARVLPVLEELRPGAAGRAARGAAAMAQAVAVVERAVDAAWERGVRHEGDALAINARAFAGLLPAVREGVLRRCVDRLGGAGHDRLSAATLRSLAAWIDGGSGSRLAGGLRFEHGGASVVVSRA